MDRLHLDLICIHSTVHNSIVTSTILSRDTVLETISNDFLCPFYSFLEGSRWNIWMFYCYDQKKHTAMLSLPRSRTELRSKPRPRRFRSTRRISALYPAMESRRDRAIGVMVAGHRRRPAQEGGFHRGKYWRISRRTARRRSTSASHHRMVLLRRVR